MPRPSPPAAAASVDTCAEEEPCGSRTSRSPTAAVAAEKEKHGTTRGREKEREVPQTAQTLRRAALAPVAFDALALSSLPAEIVTVDRGRIEIRVATTVDTARWLFVLARAVSSDLEAAEELLAP